jgi:two-component system C4-dicarboxylate transport sensor histidine kinase DctB
VAHDAAQLQDTLARLDSIEREFAALQDEVRHTDALATVGGLTAGLAHELNNLLTPALGYAQLAERSPHNQELVGKALRRTIDSIQAATRLLDATLDLATPGGARSSANASIDLALTDAVACLVRDPARDGITLDRTGTTGLHVRMTQTELQQILVNLLTNATRVLRRQGGGHIRVHCSATSDRVTIVVSDDGPGIPAKLRTHLFKPFVTSETPSPGAPQQGGRGLGLAICHRTIAARRGSIAVGQSTEGGAAFTIELPRVDPADQSHASSDPASPRAAA